MTTLKIVRSVSYTHLDVYKRQRVPSILISGGGNFPVAKKHKQNADRDRNYGEYAEISKPVSYTHLDVYKRQSHHRDISLFSLFTNGWS